MIPVATKAISEQTRMLRITRSYRRAPKFCPENVDSAMPNADITIQ